MLGEGQLRIVGYDIALCRGSSSHWVRPRFNFVREALVFHSTSASTAIDAIEWSYELWYCVRTT
jgi:hypothetical protein